MSTLASVIEEGLFSALPAASIAGRLYFCTDPSGSHQGQVLRDNGSSWTTEGYLGASAGGSSTGRLINVQRITTTGAYTYTPTAGTNSIIVELQAAGGGGSGVASPGGSTVNLGTGGGGGGWIRKSFSANFSGATGSVGAKGAGGAAGNNNGAAGGDTTFTDAGSPTTTYTAHGGLGGSHNGAFSAPFIAGGVLGGVATDGDDNRPGGPSATAIAVSTNNNFGSGGGSSMYSPGAIANALGGTNTSAAGVAASGNGGGGSGAVATGSGIARAGGDGSDGVVIIWEYS